MREDIMFKIVHAWRVLLKFRMGAHRIITGSVTNWSHYCRATLYGYHVNNNMHMHTCTTTRNGMQPRGPASHFHSILLITGQNGSMQRASFDITIRISRDIDRDRIYNCVRACFYAAHRHGWQNNPDYYGHDLSMLLATCLASEWFTSKQWNNIKQWNDWVCDNYDYEG